MYQKRSYRGESQSLVTAEICVAEDGAGQGGEVGSAIEGVDKSCGIDGFHVEHSSQIHQEVGCGTSTP